MVTKYIVRIEQNKGLAIAMMYILKDKARRKRLRWM
jgi:hypothetical protein